MRREGKTISPLGDYGFYWSISIMVVVVVVVIVVRISNSRLLIR